jgi:hypothetical protein
MGLTVARKDLFKEKTLKRGPDEEASLINYRGRAKRIALRWPQGIKGLEVDKEVKENQDHKGERLDLKWKAKL